MRSFLQQVAEHYAATTHLEDLCFVFPNRRSGKFFEQQLSHAVNGPAMMPRIMPMVDFLSDLTGYNQVGQLEAILVLYKSYRQVMGDNASPMDTFVFWANLIINDFNDADMNLVDVERLYANLHDLREISTDYLSADLKRDIERLLNISLPMLSDDERFWRDWHMSPDDSEVKRSVFSLWERLHDIYKVYHEMLEHEGLHTVGRIYRDAVERVKQVPDVQLPARVVMVGFSSLSVSELSIFKALQQRGVADFWWDNALEELSHDGDNPSGRVVHEYAQMFAMPSTLVPESLSGKQVEAVSVPSSVGQAKWAFHRVDQLVKDGHIPHPENAIDTAIVLPDESLFIPLMNSVSDSIGNLNVTMGYSLRHSNIVSLMHLVARAHKQSSRRDNEWTYYREDVKDIMSHPIIKAVFTRQAMQVSNRIADENLWSIPANWLCKMGFESLFEPLRDTSDSSQVLSYLDRLTAFCHQVTDCIKALDEVKTTVDYDDYDDDASMRKVLPLQSAFIALYVEALEQLRLAFTMHGVPVSDDTLFFLIDRLTQSFVVPFEGEPLQGLQIMGLQETRSLDFDNLIILSMNERVFPRRHGIASLIPDDLRAAFYMLTSTRQEAIAAYDFYRLISRAQRVILVYSTATSGVGGSEPSRFISQLKLLYGDRLHFTEYRVDTHVTTPGETPIMVSKARAPMHDYVNPSALVDPQHAKCLSHSSIAEYMECPLKFYLHHVQHLSDNTDTGDFMDYGTFGNIIHDTLQALYYPPLADGREREGCNIVTADDIERFKKGEMQRQVVRHINEQYLRHEATAPIEGEALIMQETIETFVLRALNHDLKQMSEAGVDRLEVLECEKSHPVQLDFDGVKFNFTYKPDRVDRLAGQLRMIDYKTGGDPTEFKSLDDLFAAPNTSEKRRKAIAQLMLYCNAWQLEHPDDHIIHPIIYKLRNMDEAGVFHSEGKGKKHPLIFNVDDEFNLEFKKRMSEVIASLLDRGTPFVQADADSKCCSYCRFSDFCRR